MLFFVVSVTGRATPSGTWGWAFSNTQKWIVQGVTSADKARDFIRKGHLSGKQKDKGTRENCSATWLAVWGFMVMRFVSWLSLPITLTPRVLPGGVHIAQPRWCPVRRILGGGRMCGISFRPFLNSSNWWGFVGFLFLNRTSCHKITQAHGYNHAWPGWAVLVTL